MMRCTAVLVLTLFAATANFAQTNPPSQPQPAGSTQPPQSSAPAQAPSAQAPDSGTHRMLQAKSQEEMKAYQAANAITDPAQAQAAADDFAAKYPNSELRTSLYMRVMNLYGQANNTEKVITTGRQAIAADPTNPVPLVQVAAALAESTRDTDLDREQRLSEAAKDAQAAIDNLDTGLLVPANADPARVEAAKRSILSMAYDTLGTVDMNRNDFASAVTNLQKAISESQSNPEAVLYLRLSVAQDKLNEYPQALDSANRAVQYAQAGSAAQSLAKQQQARLQKLISAGAPVATTAPAAAGTQAPATPAKPSPTTTSPPSPH